MIRVLHFEDDPHVAATLRHAIVEAGMEYIGYAHPGSNPIALVEQIQPSVILSDVNMPKMDGFTLVEILKHNPSTQNIPICMLTSLSGAKDKQHAFSLGVNKYFVKRETLPQDILTTITQLFYDIYVSPKDS